MVGRMGNGLRDRGDEIVFRGKDQHQRGAGEKHGAGEMRSDEAVGEHFYPLEYAGVAIGVLEQAGWGHWGENDLGHSW